MTITFGRDPVREEVAAVLADLHDGVPRDRWESKHVDLKEEKGRRGRDGVVGPGNPRDEQVAEQMFHEAACMANTPGGGALIVGVSDRGELIGAATDAEWLRHRIYEKSDRRLTVDVTEVYITRDDTRVRLLVIYAMEALEPIRVNKRIHWRVNDHCVEVDTSTWHEQRLHRWGFDWSAQPTTVPIAEARAVALELARDFLRDSGEESALNLASTPDSQLLARLNVATPEGLLTNAGVLMFVGRNEPCLDYIRRDVTGGDTLQRINHSRALIEELSAIFSAMRTHIPMRQVMLGFHIAQERELPLRAVREAVVNGVAHRDWATGAPTVVEHIGRTLRVTSPGGFVGGVTSENILTHPSTSRNPSLTQLLADLGIAEREGVGVDLMVGDMIRVGHNPPSIVEIGGPYVRTSLVGNLIDIPWRQWLSKLSPSTTLSDVNSLLVLRHVVTEGWIDDEGAAELTQLSRTEASEILSAMREITTDGHPVVIPVDGIPEGVSQPLTLSTEAVRALENLDAENGHRRSWPTRRGIAVSYARTRGRISSTELASMTRAHASNAGRTLKSLEAEGVLTPSTSAGGGRGFHYTWPDARAV